MTKNERDWFMVIGIIFAIVISGGVWLKWIDTAQAIQITISFILALITAIYVKRTSDIAQATKKQADASVRMAEEMREQTLALYKPNIVLETLTTTRGRYFVKEMRYNQKVWK
jgi:membrane protein implicated in regulation of membrane protease activity